MSEVSGGYGACPDHMLRGFINSGAIKGADPKNIQPASLDLSLSSEVYRIESLVLPEKGETIQSLLKLLGARRHKGRLFERGVIYLARLNERLNLPKCMYGYCNPKSTTGRNDVHTRVLADGVSGFDTLTPKGFAGNIWCVIVANSFPVIIPSDTSVSQLRIFNKDTRFSQSELESVFDEVGLLRDVNDTKLHYDQDVMVADGDGSVLLTADLDGEDDVAGWECRGSTHPVSFAVSGKYPKEDFFNPVRVSGGQAFLEKGKFYIFSTYESVYVPCGLAAEVVPVDVRIGEFRSHYAGFIDPGFEGTLTLEVRPYENITLRHRQPIARIRHERIISPSEKTYVGNYHHQRGPKLGRNFR